MVNKLAISETLSQNTTLHYSVDKLLYVKCKVNPNIAGHISKVFFSQCFILDNSHVKKRYCPHDSFLWGQYFAFWGYLPLSKYYPLKVPWKSFALLLLIKQTCQFPNFRLGYIHIRPNWQQQNLNSQTFSS